MKFTLEKITVLLGMIFLGKFMWTNELAYLIHPRYFWLVYVSFFILIFVFAYDKQNHHSHSKIKWGVWVMNFVFICGILFPLLPITSIARDKVNTAPFDEESFKRSKRLSQFTFNSASRSLEDWVILISLNPELSDYVGQEIHIEGFYIVNDDNKPMVGQQFINCCAADASLLSFYLKESLPYDINQWVQIEGIVEIITIDGSNVLAININNHKAVETPSAPYVVR